MAGQTSTKAKCADCGHGIHRTAPGTGYEWAHDSLTTLLACPGTERMTRPVANQARPVCVACDLDADPGTGPLGHTYAHTCDSQS